MTMRGFMLLWNSEQTGYTYMEEWIGSIFGNKYYAVQATVQDMKLQVCHNLNLQTDDYAGTVT